MPDTRAFPPLRSFRCTPYARLVRLLTPESERLTLKLINYRATAKKAKRWIYYTRTAPTCDFSELFTIKTRKFTVRPVQ